MQISHHSFSFALLAILISFSSCASRPDSPYYVDKGLASNKYEKKVVKRFNNLVEDYAKIIKEPQNALTNRKVLGYEKDLNQFSNAVKNGIANRRIGIDVARGVGRNIILLSTDFIKNFQSVLPATPDLLDVLNELTKQP